MSDKISITMLPYTKKEVTSLNGDTFEKMCLPDTFPIRVDDGEIVVAPFYVVMHTNIVQINDGLPSHMSDGEGRLLIITRIEKNSVSKNRRVCVDLDKHVLDLAKWDYTICGTEFHYINYMRKFQVPEFLLAPGYGMYHLKAIAGWLNDDGDIRESDLKLMSAYEISFQGKSQDIMKALI